MDRERGNRAAGETGEAVYSRVSYGSEGGSAYRVQPEKPPPKLPVRIVTPIRVAILLMVLLGGFIFAFRNGWLTPGPSERELRQTALVEVAPLQIDDTTSPLAGPVGVDTYGYPTQYVDPAVLRAMLTRKRYDDLTKYFEQFQGAFEKDPKHEYWINDAAAAFGSAEPALKDQLDAWVMASPDSFAPYLARGSHWEGVGFARRGKAFIPETPLLDLKAMNDAFTPAEQDLAKAISLRPRLVAAKRYRVIIEATRGKRAQMRQILDDSLIDCPTCFQVRSAYLFLSTPRWGGNYAEMSAVASAAPVSQNPRLGLLPGYVDMDKASIARRSKDSAGALVDINRASALGDFADFFREREKIEDVAGDPKAAMADIERAIALRPKTADYLAERAYLQKRNRDFEASARSLLEALRIDPTDSNARGQYEDVVQGVVFLIQEDHKAKNDKDALRIADLGADLAPANRDVQKWRMWILSGGEKGTAAGASAAAAMKASGAVPDDIDDVRRMDYSLSSEGKYADILPLWDAYLAKHPDDGRAYLERGGTHLHLGQNDLAGQDALKACDLGVNEGCLRARQLGL